MKFKLHNSFFFISFSYSLTTYKFFSDIVFILIRFDNFVYQ
uniref:Uncharacterized protein n=1 Tax=Rhizophora mucronata TaxID=61149 RepID=A0A2P2M4J2_RHIMU